MVEKNDDGLQFAMDKIFGPKPWKNFRPHASYFESMDFLWVLMTDCSPSVDPVGDSDGRFDLLRDPHTDAVVGLRIQGFSELVRSPHKMARKIQGKNLERLVAKKKQRARRAAKKH